MIKYLIVDDEPIAHDIIKGYCDMLPNLVLQKNCYDAIEAFTYLNYQQVDLIFLDLNMPKIKGFEFLKTLTNPPKIIVTTAYQEFALESYELNVVDYLLKPFSFERFLKAVNKAMITHKSLEINPTKNANVKEDSIFLRSEKKYFQVRIDLIIFLEASGNNTKVVINNETIIIREKISELLKLLPHSEFIQVHKSFVVAKKHIKSIEGNEITLGTHVVPIGKVYRMNINELLA